MLNGRLYRAAFLPFLIALAVAAFSLGSRPLPQTSTLAPDAFEGSTAFAEMKSLAARFPQRSPGSAGDQALARQIASSIDGLGGAAGGGFAVQVRHLEGQTIEGQRQLTTVLAERPGSTGATPILIVAHRDAAATGDPGEMSATAALLELARVFASRETKRTIVLASTSGGSGGAGGAAGLLESLSEAGVHGPFDAAIVLGDLAGASLRRPLVVPYSDGLGSAPLELQRTVADAISQQTGWDPGAPSTLGQLAHLTFPLAVGEQGVLDAQGLPAVLVQASGERGPTPHERLSAERLEGLGRGVLSAVDALDTAPDVPQALQSGVVLEHKTVPEWALRLLLGTLLLPPLLAAADGLARLRRRRAPVGRWTLWTLSCGLPFICAAVFCWLLGKLGIIAAPSVPVPAGAIRLDGAVVAALVAVALTFVLAWALRGALLRRIGLPRRPDPDVAGLSVVLVLAVLSIVVWIGNPYTALLLIPALHLWLLLAAPELRPGRPAALGLLALGLAPFALLLAFYADQLGLGAGALAWSAVLMLAGGHVGLGSALLWSVAFGCAAAAARLAALGPVADLEPPPPEGAEITIRGPLSYAGPGSLGGTESALRR
ncbi:MAG: M28 family peptidase [Solirubrobacteraceae bacterium]